MAARLLGIENAASEAGRQHAPDPRLALDLSVDAHLKLTRGSVLDARQQPSSGVMMKVELVHIYKKAVQSRIQA